MGARGAWSVQVREAWGRFGRAQDAGWIRCAGWPGCILYREAMH
jgi:hypothetical protein